MRYFQVKDGFGLQNLKPAERQEAPPGPGEVQVRIQAASLNYRDLLMIEGRYDPRVPLPLIPLSDGAGVVEAVGVQGAPIAGDGSWKPGEKVVLLPSQGWLSGPPDRNTPHRTLGGRTPGTLQELINVPAHSLVPMPDHLSFEEAASFACAGLTAWSALVTYGQIKPGDVILTQGTGGVSIFALQFALLHGARVIATTSSSEKAQMLIQMGALHAINYKENADWEEEIRRLTEDRGVDHVVEVGGAGTLEKSIKCARPGGTISLIGVLAGGQKDLNLLPIVMRNIKAQGILIGHRESLLHMFKAVSSSALKPVIDRTFSFEESPEAVSYLKGGSHMGKVCIRF